MVRFQHFQTRHINIQVHLFLDPAVTGAQCFDLRIAECLLIHIVTGSHRRFAGHNLRNKFLLVLQRLVKVSVKSAFRHILVDLNLFVSVALADDTPISLCHIGRTPAHIQVMDSHKQVLAVGASPHLLRGAEQHPHLTRAHFSKEFFFLYLVVRIMNESNFFCRNAPCDQLCLDVVIDIKRTVIFWGAHIAEQELRQTAFLSFLPYPEHISHTGIELAVRIIWQERVHQTLVKPDFPAIRSNFEHIVLGRINLPAVDGSRPLRERRNHFFLNLRGLHHNRLKLCFRYRQIQLVTGFYIRDFFKKVHQFRQIEKFCKPGSCPVSGSFRSQFNRRSAFPEGGRPAVKVGESLLL